MSINFLQQDVPDQATKIRVYDANIDNMLTTKDIQLDNFVFKKHLEIQQLVSPTTDIDAAGANNLYIITQPFTTPHTTNNTTSFIILNFNTQPTGAKACINLNLNTYGGGAAGLPIVTGRTLSAQRYEVTVINLGTTDLAGPLIITAESTYFI